MKPGIHLLLSAVLAFALFAKYNWMVIFIIAGGVLIDVDHYIWYIVKFRKFNLAKSYKYFSLEVTKNNWKDVTGSIFFFHIVEFFALAAALSFYSPIMLMFTVGLVGHYLLDAIWIYSVPKRFITNPSLISWLYKTQIQKL